MTIKRRCQFMIETGPITRDDARAISELMTAVARAASEVTGCPVRLGVGFSDPVPVEPDEPDADPSAPTERAPDRSLN